MKFALMRFFKPPVLILTLIIAFHLFLISKTFTIDSAGNMRAAFAGFGDIPFHMTQVSKFAYSPTLNFNEPIFDGERMRYSFLINALSGVILRFSGNWVLAMHLPAMSFMALGTLLTFFIYRNFLKSSYGALIALIIFLLGAGFGANQYFYNYLNTQTSNNRGFVNYLVDNSISTTIKYDAAYPDQNIVWGAPMSLVFLHQRAFLLGFFIFSLFWFLLEKWQKKPNDKILTIAIGVVVSFGPFGHLHSFIVMCVVLACLGLAAIINKNYFFFRHLIVLGLIIFILTVPQIIYLIQGKETLLSAQESLVKFRLGWMTEPGIGSVNFNPESGFILGRIFPFLNFLLLNFGVVLPVFIIAGINILWFSSFRKRFGGILFSFAIGVALFIIVQLIRFQPWDFDNNKLLVYFQFFAAPVFVAYFMWILEWRKKLGIILFAAFTTLALYSGIIDQIPRLMVPFSRLPVIFDKDSIATAEFIKTNIPANEKIITSSTHLNPVSSLAGRPVFVGYPGWLWTRGIDYSFRENNLRLYYQDPITNKSIATLLNAKYVLLDPSAIYDWHAPLATFNNNYQLVFNQGQFYLYKLY